MRKFKLIKTYPNSPKLGCIVVDTNPNNGATDAYFSENWGEPNNKGGFFIARHHKCEENPEFWEEIKETEKLCVPIGTKFTVDTSDILFLIKRINTNGKVYVSWEPLGGREYSVETVNKYFTTRVWKIYVEKPVLFVTEDGKEIREGDNFWVVTESFEIKYWDFKVMDSIELNIYYFKGKKRFSTKQAAQEYIDMNKPIYSKKQALEMLQALDEFITGDDDIIGLYNGFLI